MIVFRNIGVRYANGVQALSQINLSIANGEFVFVVGSSGSGKSTLLKLLYREIAPTEGSTWVDDLEVSALSRREVPLLRRRLGVVFQDFRLLPYKTAVENVSYALQVIGAEPRDLHRRAVEALGQVGLAGRAGARPDELSGGEQQRVSIARALVNRPTLLLADEPTGNLDPESSADLMKILEAINAGGTTVMVATHDRDIVNRMAKRVIELTAGRVVRDDAEGAYDRAAEPGSGAPAIEAEPEAEREAEPEAALVGAADGED
jgi:cell division transport system ATP-binding protein